MSTKISGVDGSQVVSVGPGRAVQRSRDAAAGSASSAHSSDDSQDVQITGTARTLAALEQALRDIPAVDEARVSGIRTAIEQGTYSVRPQHIADQLLSLEHTLGHLPDSPESEGSSPGNPGP